MRRIGSSFSAVGIAYALGACGGADPTALRPSNLSVSAAPTSTSFDEEVVVELRTSRPARIYFSTDGSMPAEEPSQLYDGPIRLSTQSLLSFIAISDDGVFSQFGSELYRKRVVLEIPETKPRLLQVEKAALFFEAGPGSTKRLHKTVLVRSIGNEPVRIARVFLSPNPKALGFYAPESFELVRGEPGILLPGETAEIEISYAPSDTLRSAIVVVDSNSQRSDGINVVELWGRKIAW